MFTGIIAAVGQIVRADPISTTPILQAPSQEVPDQGAGLRLHVEAGGLDLSDVALGDSIALQGACMTVIAKTATQFQVEVSRESLARTVGLAVPGAVNLEKALQVGDALGGHLVSGHVDGLAEVVRMTPVGESHELVLNIPATLARFMAYKGSVAVNGVSLTVNEVEDHGAGCHIHINLIAHTLAATTLGALRAGSRVNIEVDTIARYVARMLGQAAPA